MLVSYQRMQPFWFVTVWVSDVSHCGALQNLHFVLEFIKLDVIDEDIPMSPLVKHKIDTISLHLHTKCLIILEISHHLNNHVGLLDVYQLVFLTTPFIEWLQNLKVGEELRLELSSNSPLGSVAALAVMSLVVIELLLGDFWALW